MIALVTGGAGFIGSHLVDLLIKGSHKAVVVDDLSRGRKSNVNRKAAFYGLSINDPRTEDIFRKHRIDVIFHLAAQGSVLKSVEDPVHDADINILGSLRILEFSRKYGVKKVIYSNSGGAGAGEPVELPINELHPIRPISPYGVSKHTVEHYLFVYGHLFGLRYSSLRYSNVYGPRQDTTGEGGVIAVFSKALSEGKRPVIYGDGNQTRDFIYVEDAALANMLLVDRGDFEAFNISTGEEITINAVFKKLKAIAGSDIFPEYAAGRKGEIYRSALSNRKITLLGWKPLTGLEEGLSRTYQSIKNEKA